MEPDIMIKCIDKLDIVLNPDQLKLLKRIRNRYNDFHVKLNSFVLHWYEQPCDNTFDFEIIKKLGFDISKAEINKCKAKNSYAVFMKLLEKNFKYMDEVVAFFNDDIFKPYKEIIYKKEMMETLKEKWGTLTAVDTYELIVSPFIGIHDDRHLSDPGGTIVPAKSSYAIFVCIDNPYDAIFWSDAYNCIPKPGDVFLFNDTFDHAIFPSNSKGIRYLNNKKGGLKFLEYTINYNISKGPKTK